MLKNKLYKIKSYGKINETWRASKIFSLSLVRWRTQQNITTCNNHLWLCPWQATSISSYRFQLLKWNPWFKIPHVTQQYTSTASKK